jgi:hypothetical protein
MLSVLKWEALITGDFILFEPIIIIIKICMIMYDYTSNNWSHWGCNEKLKGKFWKLYQENIR